MDLVPLCILALRVKVEKSAPLVPEYDRVVQCSTASDMDFSGEIE